jgi:hypothetical protein
MPVFADNFLAGALITLLIPGAVLVAVATWYTRIVLRRTREDADLRATAAAGDPAPPNEETSGATP